MTANYNNVAWFYERLSKIIFGQAQVKAQNFFLNSIKAGSHIIIIGGGTGEILESITKIHPIGLHITYIETSTNMMALSRKRDTGQNEVNYITDNIEKVTFVQQFDVVITAFLLDNFSDKYLAAVFPHIHARLKLTGLWLNTDFQLTGKLWQKVMLKMMYAFFGLFNAIEVTKLPDTNLIFRKYGYYIIGEKFFYRNFIASKMYKKI
ncbi:class I SAM-dependent methyltransferase [Mucilaginibacter terrae]|uniref:class I SAM-dependent methyltransferase n=1 Tax=Mucilaginibacter terrae TaxID=1955052 RepID=UPI00363C90EE